MVEIYDRLISVTINQLLIIIELCVNEYLKIITFLNLYNLKYICASLKSEIENLKHSNNSP